VLAAKGINAFVRRPRGRDIYAACGQLAARRTNAISQLPMARTA
jgi:adenine C2-methylase RlmN of 23S rRNA A2503 and tRNA A37